jgi:hypothetical protein
MPVRSFNLLALFFILLFGVQVMGSLIPWRPLDPAWQWSVANAVLNQGMLPLLSLALLQALALLAPEDESIQRRRRLFSNLAVVAALGFLLLLPLQLNAGLRQQTAFLSTQRGRIATAEQRLVALRQAMNQATTTADLQKRFQALQGPTLSPLDLERPLPLIKAQLRSVFTQAEIQIQRERASLPPGTNIAAVPNILRNSFICLLLAGGYAVFAHRGDRELSLFEEIELWGLNLLKPKGKRRQDVSDEEYIRQLSGDEEDS